MLRYIGRVKLTAATAASILLARIVAEASSVYLLSPIVTSISGDFPSKAGDPSGGVFAWLLGKDPGVAHLRTALLCMALSQVVLGLLTYLRSVWEAKLSMRAVFHLRHDVYDKLQRAGIPLHDRIGSGQLINRSISDLQAVRSFVNSSVFLALDFVFSAGVYLVLLGFRSGWLAAAALIPIPACVALVNNFNRKSRRVYAAQQDATENVVRALTDCVYGARTVRACGAVRRETRRYRILERRLLSRLVESVSYQARFVPLFRGSITVAHVALFAVATYLAARRAIPVGDIVILGSVMAILTSKLQQLSSFVEAYQKASVSAKRLFEILDWKPESGASASRPLRPGGHGAGKIEVSRLSFNYPGSERRILDHASVSLAAKSMTVIAGASGSGKSTLAALMARLYEAGEGEIRLDGESLLAADVEEARRNVLLSPHGAFLFSGTVRENISFGRIDAGIRDVEAAARAASAHEFIRRLPEGYDTWIGEGGAVLSGGQRQRLSLARALLTRSPVLVLDDPTSALDMETEAEVLRQLRALSRERTMIVISNRPSVMKAADQLLRIRDGKIVHENRVALFAAAPAYGASIKRRRQEVLAQ